MRSCSKVGVNGSSPAVAGGSFSSGVYQLGDGEGRQFQHRHVLGNKRFTYLALVVRAQCAANFHHTLAGYVLNMLEERIVEVMPMLRAAQSKISVSVDM
jgi:hypothetical protein